MSRRIHGAGARTRRHARTGGVAGIAAAVVVAFLFGGAANAGPSSWSNGFNYSIAYLQSVFDAVYVNTTGDTMNNTLAFNAPDDITSVAGTRLTLTPASGQYCEVRSNTGFRQISEDGAQWVSLQHNSGGFRLDTNLCTLPIYATGSCLMDLHASGGVLASVPFTAQNKFTANTDFLSTAVSPAQLTGDQNDYANCNNAYFCRLSSTVPINITGLGSGDDGKRKTLCNVNAVGGNAITLKHASASSLAANRFAFAGSSDVIIAAGECRDVIYDLNSTLWREIK